MLYKSFINTEVVINSKNKKCSLTLFHLDLYHNLTFAYHVSIWQNLYDVVFYRWYILIQLCCLFYKIFLVLIRLCHRQLLYMELYILVYFFICLCWYLFYCPNTYTPWCQINISHERKETRKINNKS